MNRNTVKDGILQGVVVKPFSGQSIDIRFVGSVSELALAAMFLGLELSQEQTVALQEDRNDGALVVLRDLHGSYATLQPVDRASDLLHTIAAEHQLSGETAPFEKN